MPYILQHIPHIAHDPMTCSFDVDRIAIRRYIGVVSGVVSKKPHTYFGCRSDRNRERKTITEINCLVTIGTVVVWHRWDGGGILRCAQHISAQMFARCHRRRRRRRGRRIDARSSHKKSIEPHLIYVEHDNQLADGFSHVTRWALSESSKLLCHHNESRQYCPALPQFETTTHRIYRFHRRWHGILYRR